MCLALLGGSAEHDEAGIVSPTESRPFWIEYAAGVVTVGKGGQATPFLEWNAGAYHGKVSTAVHVGISSWRSVTGYWLFYQ